ncbi:MAG: hypothetical protein LIO57_00955, partial [Oscillospiraceae bacterium]|nr:hypothetical protein [Oscillospiraceae bacterium]
MSSKSQRKGRAAELELARLLQNYGYDVQAAPPLSFGSLPDIYGLDGVHIECKRTETLRLNDWLKQSAHDSAKFADGVPAVMHRSSRRPWCVTMLLSDW